MPETKSKTFILGAGFSALAGFPLIADLKAQILHFIETFHHPSWATHLEPSFHYPEGQFYAGLNRIDAGRSLPFEELLSAATRYLATAIEQDPCWVTKKVLENAVGQMFWAIFRRLVELCESYLNFASWLNEHHGYGQPNAIVSFNWDVLAECTLKNARTPWSYSARGPLVPILKPHGSINWSKHLQEGLRAESAAWQPIGPDSPFSYIPENPFSDPFAEGPNQDLRYLIFPADSDIPQENEGLRQIWNEVSEAIAERESVIFIGYSLPPYDSFATRILQTATRGKKIIVFNPSDEHLARFKQVFGPATETYPLKFEQSPYGKTRFQIGDLQSAKQPRSERIDVLSFKIPEGLFVPTISLRSLPPRRPLPSSQGRQNRICTSHEMRHYD